MESKGIFSSKTVLFNALSPLLLMYLSKKGVSLTPEEVATFFAVGNVILRAVTSSGLNVWKLF